MHCGRAGTRKTPKQKAGREPGRPKAQGRAQTRPSTSAQRPEFVRPSVPQPPIREHGQNIAFQRHAVKDFFQDSVLFSNDRENSESLSCHNASCIRRAKRCPQCFALNIGMLECRLGSFLCGDDSRCCPPFSIGWRPGARHSRPSSRRSRRPRSCALFSITPARSGPCCWRARSCPPPLP